jgi:phosphoglycolate phosphatase
LATITCGAIAFTGIEAVIFDKDGTLADSQDFLRSLGQKRARLIDAQLPGVETPLLLAFGLEGAQLNPAGLMAIGTREENEIAAAAYIAETGKDWTESLQIARSAFAEADTYFSRKASSTPLFQGALDLLQRLAAVGVQLGIASSDSPANVQDFVDCYQLNPPISVALGSEPGLSKPDPALLNQACDSLGVRPEHTLVVGDSTTDLTLAAVGGAAGCIAVAWGWTNPQHLQRADACIQNFAEIQVCSQ